MNMTLTDVMEHCAEEYGTAELISRMRPDGTWYARLHGNLMMLGQFSDAHGTTLQESLAGLVEAYCEAEGIL